jgi:hypothetical protein
VQRIQVKHVRVPRRRSFQVFAAVDVCALVAVSFLVAMNVASRPAEGASASTSAVPSATSAPSDGRAARLAHHTGHAVLADVDGDGRLDQVTISKLSDGQWRLRAKLAATTCSGTIPALSGTDPALYGAYRPQGSGRDLVLTRSDDIGDHATVDLWELGPKCRWMLAHDVRRA